MAKHSAPLQAQKKRHARKAKAKPPRAAAPPADAVERFEVEMLAPEKVIPYARNPRLNADAVSGVAGSLKEFGWRQPIVVDDKMVVLVGHTRLLAAQQLGLQKVPVHIARGLTPQQARAYRLADNRLGENAKWDNPMLGLELSELSLEGFDVSLTGFTTDEVATLTNPEGGILEGADVDEVPPVPSQPITKPGDLIILGRHRLLCGDATSVRDMARLLDGASVDLCLTDPPYCSGGFQESGRSMGSVGTSAVHKQIANDRLSTRGYQALLKQAFSNSGAPFLYAFTDWRMWVWLFDIAESCGYGVRSMIAWDKGTPGMGRGWRSQHELILWACKATTPFDKHASGCGNVLSEKRTGNIHHTTEKPVSILAALLENTPFAATVIDPFAGSGTTLIASEQCDRTCFASELDAGYCDVIVARWEKATGQTAERP